MQDIQVADEVLTAKDIAKSLNLSRMKHYLLLTSHYSVLRMLLSKRPFLIGLLLS